MKIAVISGSMRDGSQSLRVANYIVERLKELGVEPEIVDLNKQRLPIYDDTDEGDWKPTWEQIDSVLKAAEGYVFVSPEWDGMFSVGIHNMLHYAANDTMADKPVFLVGVSSGRGGRYPLQQMRTMGYKNKHFVVIPESIYFDHIKEALVDGKFTDERNSQRLDYDLKVLLEYAKALKQVRASGVTDYKTYRNGL